MYELSRRTAGSRWTKILRYRAKNLDLVSCVAEVEQLCGEIQAATEEMRHILALMKF